MLDSELIDSLPESILTLQKVLGPKTDYIRKDNGGRARCEGRDRSTAEFYIFFFIAAAGKVERGLPVYKAEIRGEKLERRDITVTRGDAEMKLSIAMSARSVSCWSIGRRTARSGHDLPV